MGWIDTNTNVKNKTIIGLKSRKRYSIYSEEVKNKTIIGLKLWN